MTEARCYRDRNNGVYYQRTHRPDCDERDCKGCQPCEERHCTARKGCTWHVSEGELTCAQELATVRRHFGWIEALSALMPTEAQAAGIESEAANLAGPAGDPRVLTDRRVLLKRQIRERLPESKWAETITALVEDDDEHHAYSVTTRWHMMIAEDYGHEMPDHLTISGSIDYLKRNLHRIANDPEQDFQLLANEIRKCRQHYELVLHNDRRRPRGAPCRSCPSPAPRLVLDQGHWCNRSDCFRKHYADDSGDRWVCPADPDHWWSQRDYERWVYADAHESA